MVGYGYGIFNVKFWVRSLIFNFRIIFKGNYNLFYKYFLCFGF